MEQNVRLKRQLLQTVVLSNTRFTSCCVFSGGTQTEVQHAVFSQSRTADRQWVVWDPGLPRIKSGQTRYNALLFLFRILLRFLCLLLGRFRGRRTNFLLGGRYIAWHSDNGFKGDSQILSVKNLFNFNFKLRSVKFPKLLLSQWRQSENQPIVL